MRSDTNWKKKNVHLTVIQSCNGRSWCKTTTPPPSPSALRPPTPLPSCSLVFGPEADWLFPGTSEGQLAACQYIDLSHAAAAWKLSVLSLSESTERGHIKAIINDEPYGFCGR